MSNSPVLRLRVSLIPGYPCTMNHVYTLTVFHASLHPLSGSVTYPEGLALPPGWISLSSWSHPPKCVQ